MPPADGSTNDHGPAEHGADTVHSAAVRGENAVRGSDAVRGTATRERILSVARACFSAAGYDATGVAEICQRAGVSKGAFYHHFGSKQALFLALFEQWLGELWASIGNIDAADGPVPAQLADVAAMIQDIPAVVGHQAPIFLEFWTQAARQPELWQATMAPYHAYRDLFAALIARGVAEGSLRPVDPTAAAHVVVSLGVGLLLQALLDAQGIDWGKVSQQSLQILLDGLARP
jgi:AcrR family transcriptional regulator